MTEYLSLDSLMIIAARAIAGEVLVRDYGLLESALARPRTTVFGTDAYPTVHQKAAALLHSLTSTHALVEGDKRLAFLAMAVFLQLNGHRLVATDDELFELVLSIADGSPSELAPIAQRLAGFTKPV